MKAFETKSLFIFNPNMLGCYMVAAYAPSITRKKGSIGIGKRPQFLIITGRTLQLLVKTVNHLLQEEVP